MPTIRPATESDNQDLLELEKLCPQGTNLVLQFDRSPGFFLRSQVYESYKVYVAEENYSIVGTVASTEKQLRFEKQAADSVYIYDLRVNPNLRARGIGSKLILKVLEESSGSQFAYAIIMHENTPSIKLFEKIGFQSICDFTLFNIPLFKRQKREVAKIRVMTNKDVAEVVDVIDSYNQTRGFPSLSRTEFLEKANRLPGYGLSQIHVAESGNQIVACLGLWDYSRIFRVRAIRVSARMKTLAHLLRFANVFKDTMRLPLVGEPFRLMYAKDFAYIGQIGPASELIQHSLSLSYKQGCNFLSFVLDPDDPAIKMLAKYKPIRVANHIYAKNLGNEALNFPRKLLVDPADL